jgi:hypothetical protein
VAQVGRDVVAQLAGMWWLSWQGFDGSNCHGCCGSVGRDVEAHESFGGVMMVQLAGIWLLILQECGDLIGRDVVIKLVGMCCDSVCRDVMAMLVGM